MILGKVEKNLVKPIDQLIGAALSNRAIIDVLDEANGIYGREYGALNGGVKITFSSSPSTQLRFNISKALSALRKG